MKLSELKAEIQKYQYIEDTNIIDASLASIISNRKNKGDPIWLIIIGPSSGGKSQILRPLAMTDPKYMHRVDDLTENTFLSGLANKKGGEVSLLQRIGPKGMIVISDFTVIFSKSKETRDTILSQFRMIYDGEMIKHSGNNAKPISWKGTIGVIAGSTPSIYQHFEEVADMGERFIYYRMKDYDPIKATRISLSRELYGRKLDDKLCELYTEYLKQLILTSEDLPEIILTEDMNERIINISTLAEKIRTTTHVAYKTGDMDKLPVSAMPMRVALELTSLAKGLGELRRNEGGEMTHIDLEIIDWCGYSLANEEKRACLKTLSSLEYGVYMSTQLIADTIGLSTAVTGAILQNLSAVGVLQRTAGQNGLSWRINSQKDWETIRRIENVQGHLEFQERAMVEEDEMGASMNAKFDAI